ncbi:hypothetical protein C8R43DRAFT_1048188 [Mycena crocata]|nr:hypothetical protein C8R43DRAFT_1048188 [Mycena crocata]
MDTSDLRLHSQRPENLSDGTSSVETWRQIFEVPAEIWDQVAVSSSRQAIARLCAVSHEFYSIFSPMLYGRTVQPPLPNNKTPLLIRTLRSAHSCAGRPHPALLPVIRNLSISAQWSHRYVWPSLEADAEQYHEALQNLVQVSTAGQLVRGAALRSLEWDIVAGIDELGTLLRTRPGYFPNLREISATSGGSNMSFEFIQIPDLEMISCSLMLGENVDIVYEIWGSLWNTLGEALSTLPSSSPLLHTFKLKLGTFALPGRAGLDDWDIRTSPDWDAYIHLIATINQIHFPALTTLELSVKSDFWLRSPAADFSAFLFGQPLLSNVALDVDLLRIPTHLAKLPTLRSFTGSVEDCVVICVRAPQLASVSLMHSGHVDEVQTAFRRFNPSPTVTSLKYLSVDDNDSEYNSELSPGSLSILGLVFPNIRRLDILISEVDLNDHRDAFVALPHMEYLCVRSRENLEIEDWEKPAAILFPLAEYVECINSMLPLLPRLSDIHLLLREHRREEPAVRGCESCDEEARQNAMYMSDLLIERRFFVNRTSGELELVDWCGEHCDYTITAVL